MAPETCKTIVIHPDFKANSPLQSILESSFADKAGSDTSISISEDLS